MKAGRTYSFLACAVLIMAAIFLVKAVLALWAHDIWFLAFGLASLFFARWAYNTYGLAIAALTDEAAKRALKPKLSETGFLKEEPSTRLSDQFGSFRDLGRR